VAGCCECGDETSGSGATELVSSHQLEYIALAQQVMNRQDKHPCLMRDVTHFLCAKEIEFYLSDRDANGSGEQS
jgi:hypothetical protein